MPLYDPSAGARAWLADHEPAELPHVEAAVQEEAPGVAGPRGLAERDPAQLLRLVARVRDELRERRGAACA